MPDYNILNEAMLELGVKDEEEKIIKEDEVVEDDIVDEELEEEEVLDTEDDEVEDEVVEKDDEIIEDDTADEEYEKTPVKPTREEKEKYAFEQLRKKAKESDAYQKQLDEIAHSYGFETSKQMVEKLQKDALVKKAQEQGVDPKFYEDLQNTKKQLEALKLEREEENERNRINKFITRVDKFAKDNNLTQEDKDTLITNLDEDGFTIETLSKIKNYENLFTGYVKDKIIAKEKQREIIKAEKRKKLSEEQLSDTGNKPEKFDLDSVLTKLISEKNSRY